MLVCTRRSTVFRNVYDYRANGGSRFIAGAAVGCCRAVGVGVCASESRRRRRRQGRGRAELGCTSQPQLLQVPTQLRGSCGVQSSSSRGSHSGGSTSQKRQSPRARPRENASDVPFQPARALAPRRHGRASEDRAAQLSAAAPLSQPHRHYVTPTSCSFSLSGGASGEGRFRQAAASRSLIAIIFAGDTSEALVSHTFDRSVKHIFLNSGEPFRRLKHIPGTAIQLVSTYPITRAADLPLPLPFILPSSTPAQPHHQHGARP